VIVDDLFDRAARKLVHQPRDTRSPRVGLAPGTLDQVPELIDIHAA
jgi:hypothetical protein